MDPDNEKNIPDDKEDVPNIEREGWETKEVAEESVNESPDDVVRKVLSNGDDDKGDADDKDIVGSNDFEDTPQGREENKNDEGDKNG
jgi:hypothetical protein